MSTALANITNTLAAKLDMGEAGQELVSTLKATAFRGQKVDDSQMLALMAVANQHQLNPWTREIYAFPDKGGIVPVVGVDGWSRIINQHPQFDGIEFEQSDKECTCRIYRKDRSHPTTVTEYWDECSRNTQPWKSHPKRMLRHKALIQCARLAFGYSGIFDQDEAERIAVSAPAEVREIDPQATRTQSVKEKMKAAQEATEDAIDVDPETGEVLPPTYEQLVEQLGNCESADQAAKLTADARLIFRSLTDEQQGTLTDFMAALKEEYPDADAHP